MLILHVAKSAIKGPRIPTAHGVRQLSYLSCGSTPRKFLLQPGRCSRSYASATTADEKIEEITELFATARDEFEIAQEETEKMTVYAEDDRKAAREEFDKVHAAYRAVVDGSDKELADEVRRRIGQRIRELESAIKNMEELAINQD